MAGDELHPFLTLALQRARAHAGVDLALPRAEGLGLDVVPREGPPFRLLLDALHHETLDWSPAQRIAAIDARLDAALRPADPWPWEQARPRLTELVRAASTLANTDLVTWPVGLGLRAGVAIDTDDAHILVTWSRLDGWGITAAGLRALAAQNARTPELTPWDPTEPRGVQCGLPDGARLDGLEAFAIPHSGLLLVADREDPASVGRLARTAAREYASGPRPVSPAVYGAGLEPLRVAREHPAFDAIEQGRVRAWADEVATQAESMGVAVTPVGVRQSDGRLALGVRADPSAPALPEAEVYIDGEGPAGPAVPGTWPAWRQRS